MSSHTRNRTNTKAPDLFEGGDDTTNPANTKKKPATARVKRSATRQTAKASPAGAASDATSVARLNAPKTVVNPTNAGISIVFH